MPTLPINPDDALNDTNLDALVKARVNSASWLDDFELRTAIRWEILRYYGLDKKYGFASPDDSTNVSLWSDRGGIEGSNDLDTSARIVAQYLARYAGDKAPSTPFTLTAPQETPIQAGISTFTKVAGENFTGLYKAISDPINWSIRNLGLIIVLIVSGYFIIQILNTKTASDVVRGEVENYKRKRGIA